MSVTQCRKCQNIDVLDSELDAPEVLRQLVDKLLLDGCAGVRHLSGRDANSTVVLCNQILRFSEIPQTQSQILQEAVDWSLMSAQGWP